MPSGQFFRRIPTHQYSAGIPARAGDLGRLFATEKYSRSTLLAKVNLLGFASGKLGNVGMRAFFSHLRQFITNLLA